VLGLRPGRGRGGERAGLAGLVALAGRKGRRLAGPGARDGLRRGGRDRLGQQEKGELGCSSERKRRSWSPREEGRLFHFAKMVKRKRKKRLR